jgi:isopenicillin-N N-acyltransferase-like protein
MMGYKPNGLMLGVNNINTDGARPGVLWPVVVRKILAANTHGEMDSILQSAPVTSGHCYLLASTQRGEFWEVMPGLAEKVSTLTAAESGYLFHTNHCLGRLAQQREIPVALNSTTHIRYELLQKKIADVRTFDDAYNLLNDHENYPKSICSNFQTSSQDPSITCGGAVGELKTGRVRMWRGDPDYDKNFIKRDFDIA